jgi:N-acetylneuraminic acid mutarotase
LAATILLPNGKVLAAGGGGGVDALSSSELYDPGTGLWSYTGSLNTARSCEAPVLLPNGQVLVAGGWYWHWEPEVPVVSYPLSSAELYNPATGLWSYTGSLATARQEQPAVLLPNGQVLTFGGYGFNETILGSAELYDPATGRWRATGSLITARVGGGSAARLLNGKVLAAGGRGSSGSGGMLASAELYHPGEAPPGINLLLLD